MAIDDWITSPYEWKGWGTKANAWFNELVDCVNRNSYSLDRDVCIAEAASNQAVTHNAFNLLVFATEITTPTGFSWNGANTECTVTDAGLYQLEVGVRWDGHATGYRGLYLATDKTNPGTIGLTTDSVRNSIQFAAVDTTTILQKMVAIFEVPADTAFGAYGFQTSGGNLNAESSSSYTHLKLTRLK